MNLQQSDLRCYFYNILSLVPTLNAVYPGHNFTLYFFNIHFNTIIHYIPVSLMLPSSFGFPYQNLVCGCLSPMHNKFLADLILQNLVILIMFPERRQLKLLHQAIFSNVLLRSSPWVQIFPPVPLFKNFRHITEISL